MHPSDLARLRRANETAGLDEADLPAEPLELVRRWLAEATEAGLTEPNAMVVATVGPTGAPSSRMVLCKGLDERGLVFYTNYGSRKARELEANPAVSLLFPWHPLGRQIRVEGTAERVSAEDSDAYFASRPRGAQLSAWASEQSAVVPDRAVLEDRVRQLAARHPKSVPRPPHWGGIRVVPLVVECWQSRPDRLHDRLVYRREESGAGWSITRLQP